MKLPTANAIVTEALTVVAGAVLAALIVGQFPALNRWLRQQWSE